MKHVLACVISAALLMVTGCSDGGNNLAQVCAPGETQPCQCPPDKNGVQECNGVGTGWKTCNCSGASEPEPDVIEDVSQPDVSGPEDTGGSDACVADNEFAYKSCVGNDIFWFDNCGEQASYIESCGAGESCNSGNGTCVESSSCDPKAYEQCHMGDVFWHDSCGQPESLAEACDAEDYCIDKSCSKGVYGGTWLMTADPSTKSLGGLGNITFADTYLTISVSGTEVTAVEQNATPEITWTGTLEGKTMKLTSVYTQEDGLGVTTSENEMTVTFSAPSDLKGVPPPIEYSGLMKQVISSDLIGDLGTVVWNVTGVKQ